MQIAYLILGGLNSFNSSRRAATQACCTQPRCPAEPLKRQRSPTDRHLPRSQWDQQIPQTEAWNKVVLTFAGAQSASC